MMQNQVIVNQKERKEPQTLEEGLSASKRASAVLFAQINKKYIFPLETEFEAMGTRRESGAVHYYEKRTKLFSAEQGRFVTKMTAPAITYRMANLVADKGAKAITVTGKTEFRKQAWLFASLRGIEVNGYEPTQDDQMLLKYAHSRQNTLQVQRANKEKIGQGKGKDSQIQWQAKRRADPKHAKSSEENSSSPQTNTSKSGAGNSPTPPDQPEPATKSAASEPLEHTATQAKHLTTAASAPEVAREPTFHQVFADNPERDDEALLAPVVLPECLARIGEQSKECLTEIREMALLYGPEIGEYRTTVHAALQQHLSGIAQSEDVEIVLHYLENHFHNTAPIIFDGHDSEVIRGSMIQQYERDAARIEATLAGLPTPDAGLVAKHEGLRKNLSRLQQPSVIPKSTNQMSKI